MLDTPDDLALAASYPAVAVSLYFPPAYPTRKHDYAFIACVFHRKSMPMKDIFTRLCSGSISLDTWHHVAPIRGAIHREEWLLG